MKPILLRAHEVRGVLDGWRTQLRRVVKPQPFTHNTYHDGDIQLARFVPRSTGQPVAVEFSVGAVGGGGGLTDGAECPYGCAGDQLWVRESWRPIEYAGRDVRIGYSGVQAQKIDASKIPIGYIAPLSSKRGDGWCSPTHMPRWASRITLEVTGVRVERLREISEADAVAEGVTAYDMYGPDGLAFDHGCTHRATFANLWESTHGTGSWDANPWVWCVSFRRVNP